jgi:DNA-binding beta-propeller fold protein YncE
MRQIIVNIIFVVLASFFANSVKSQTYQPYELENKISIPGNGGYDYLFIDNEAGRLYVSHGTAVVVFALPSEKMIGTISGMQGVHGIAIAPEVRKGFISDGKGNSVVVFDLVSLNVEKTIQITGKNPDGIMYDPFSKRVFAFNGDSQDASVIDVKSLTQIGLVSLGGAPEFAVSDGEGKIYNNSEDKNIISVIDAMSMKVIKTIPLDPCGGPTGLALDKAHNRLFTVCRKNKGMSVVDITTGRVITTVPIGAGVDAVVYDAATSLVYCSNGDGTATIIRQESADSYSVVQTLSTQWRAKTMALDRKTKKIYFTAFDMDDAHKNRIPDTFKLLIFKQKS